MYRKRFHSRKFDKFSRGSGELTANKSSDIIEAAYNEGKSRGMPTPTIKSSEGSLYIEKRFGTLNNMRPIDVVADPNTSMSYGDFPYNIVDKNNKIIDARYEGQSNIGGNTIVQLQNDTSASDFMNVYDIGITFKTVNYLYMGIRPGSKNLAYTAELVKSVNQAVAYGFSTMTTQLPFYTEKVTTNLPAPASEVSGAKQTAAFQYTARLIHYQTVLQNLVTPISKYIETLSLEKELMRMSFRLEAPIITSLYGLFKKTSFVANVNTIGTSILNEYFDENWFKQVNLISCLPSRKTKGMVDPLLSINTIHAIPSCKINDGDLEVYDSDEVLTADFGAAKYIDPFDNFTRKDIGTKSLEEIVSILSAYLSPYYILKFARGLNNKILSDDYTVSEYSQCTFNFITAITRIAARFSSLMGHTRTFLDKMDTQGLVYWKKGFSRFVTLNKIVQYEPCYNVLTHNLFVAANSDSSVLKFDDKTKRWRTWTLWDKYTGIPEYNNKSHGAFLTAGLRNIEIPEGYTENSSIMMLPVMFTQDDSNQNNKTWFLSRRGNYCEVTHVEISEFNINKYAQFARLAPLGNVESVRVPFFTVTEAQIATWTTDMAKARIVSAMALTLDTVYRVGFVLDFVDVDSDDNWLKLPIVSHDLICYVDIELEDVSNDMILFARNYSPFRTSTPDGKRTMGFSSGSKA